MRRTFVSLSALGLIHAACYLDPDDLTAEGIVVLAVDDAGFYADGVSECVVSATYPAGASPGQPLKITTTLPGGAPQTLTVMTAARDAPTEGSDDPSPQEILRLRANLQPGDALVVVEAGKWTQQIVCTAGRADAARVTLQSTANTLKAGGATSTDLTVTLRRAQDEGMPSNDTRVLLRTCCADDNTSTCAQWFNLPPVASTTATAPERIALNVPLTALGAEILNQKVDDTHPAQVDARIFAGASEATCSELNAAVKDGVVSEPTLDFVTIRLVRQPM